MSSRDMHNDIPLFVDMLILYMLCHHKENVMQTYAIKNPKYSDIMITKWLSSWYFNCNLNLLTTSSQHGKLQFHIKQLYIDPFNNIKELTINHRPMV